VDGMVTRKEDLERDHNKNVAEVIFSPTATGEIKPTRVQLIGEVLAPQYRNSVKIEAPTGGERVTVHVYSDEEEEARIRAVRLYRETQRDLKGSTSLTKQLEDSIKKVKQGVSEK
jgi:hypothetical protein